MSGSELIASERWRQVEVEGYTAGHDAAEDDGALENAAVSYILSSIGDRKRGMKTWPWLLPFYKPKDRLRDLVRAGALIAAAIDRLQDKEYKGR